MPTESNATRMPQEPRRRPQHCCAAGCCCPLCWSTLLNNAVCPHNQLGGNSAHHGSSTLGQGSTRCHHVDCPRRRWQFKAKEAARTAAVWADTLPWLFLCCAAASRRSQRQARWLKIGPWWVVPRWYCDSRSDTWSKLQVVEQMKLVRQGPRTPADGPMHGCRCGSPASSRARAPGAHWQY